MFIFVNEIDIFENLKNVRIPVLSTFFYSMVQTYKLNRLEKLFIYLPTNNILRKESVITTHHSSCEYNKISTSSFLCSFLLASAFLLLYSFVLFSFIFHMDVFMLNSVMKFMMNGTNIFQQ